MYVERTMKGETQVGDPGSNNSLPLYRLYTLRGVEKEAAKYAALRGTEKLNLQTSG